MLIRRSPEVVAPRPPLREVLVRPNEFPIANPVFPRMGTIEFNCQRPKSNSVAPIATPLSEAIQQDQLNLQGRVRKRRNHYNRNYIENRGYGRCFRCRKGVDHPCYRQWLGSSNLQSPNSEDRPSRDVTTRKNLSFTHLKKLEFF